MRIILDGRTPTYIVAASLLAAWLMLLALQTPLLLSVGSEGNGHWMTRTGKIEGIQIILLAIAAVSLAAAGGYLSRKSWSFRFSRRGTAVLFVLCVVAFCAANVMALVVTESLLEAASASGTAGRIPGGMEISAFVLPFTMLAPPLTALVAVAVCIEGKQRNYSAVRTAKLAAKWALSIYFVAGLLIAACFFLRL